MTGPGGTGDAATGDAARTVLRAPPGADRFAALARPLVDLAMGLGRDRRPDADRIADEARRLTEAMEAAGLRAGLEARDLAAAREALWALLATQAAGNPALPRAAWRAAARRRLPGIEALTPVVLRGRLAAAERAGATDRDLARLLRHCLQAVEDAGPAAAPQRRWGLIATTLGLLVLVAWAGWTEWRFRARLIADLTAGAPVVAPAESAEAAALLDGFAAAVTQAADRGRASPLGLVARLGPLSPEVTMRQRYAAAAAQLVPPLLGAAVAESLSREGESAALYDTLRALAILNGEAPWAPDFLAGWIEDRGDANLRRLAPHVAALSSPPGPAPPPDPEILAQARAIAAEGDRVAFAAIELVRAPAMRRLPAFSLTEAVPGIGMALTRRSGGSLDQAVPGRLTAAGWSIAAGGEAARAIERMETESLRLFGAGTRPGTQVVTEEMTLDALQDQTLAAWSALLSDLRVRPFAEQPTALAVSGALSRRASPLEALFRAVWREVGGLDRSRSHAAQLRVAADFGPMIQFVENGDATTIARLFGTLNAAIAGLGADADMGRRRIMDLRARTASIVALDLAPRSVVQIVEDVLAQTAATQGDALRPLVVAFWEEQVAPACRLAIEGRYPFAAGPDADPEAVADFLGPDGALARFAARNDLAQLIDRESRPWSWRPEARFSGLSPDSAVFLQHALAVGESLFPREGSMLTLAALAQRGAATVSVGGAAALVTTATDSATLAWPGPDPRSGVQVAFETPTTPEIRSWPGPWGLLRFIEASRPRVRDGGRRFLLDVGFASSRAFLELAFERPANPLSARSLAAELSCPIEL